MNVNKILCMIIILLTGFIIIGSACAVDSDIAVADSDMTLKEPITVDINAIINDGVYGENLTGHVDTQGHNGTVIFQLVSGSSTPVRINVLEDGTFIIPNTHMLKPDTYDKASISFISDDETISGSNNVTFTINKAQATVEIIYENYSYLDKPTYGLFKLSKYAEGDFISIDYYYDAWNFYTSALVFNGEGIFDYPNLKPGIHGLVIDWVQSEYYDYTSQPAIINVSKEIPFFTVDINPEGPGDNKFTWGDNATIYFYALYQNLTGSFSYSIDNETWIPIEGYEGTFNFGSDLDAGNYILFVKYSGDDIYDEFILENPFVIEKRPVIVSIEDIVGNEGSKTKVTVKVVDDRGIPVEEGIVTIVINGKKYTAHVNNGIAIVEIELPSQGKYIAEVYYDGQYSNYADGFVIFTIDSIPIANDLINSNLMENTGNPLVLLLIALATIGIGSLKRKL